MQFHHLSVVFLSWHIFSINREMAWFHNYDKIPNEFICIQIYTWCIQFSFWINFMCLKYMNAHLWFGLMLDYFIIQIKICEESRDMLPRPRLVCQGPRLRPIGRSPGVPDKSSRGLGSMSRYSGQFLICFKAYIFHFCYSSVGLVGNFAVLQPCTVPSAIVHCNENEAGHQTIKAHSMPCWGADDGPWWRHSLSFMPWDWWNWYINWKKSVSMGSF